MGKVFPQLPPLGWKIQDKGIPLIGRKYLDYNMPSYNILIHVFMWVDCILIKFIIDVIWKFTIFKLGF